MSSLLLARKMQIEYVMRFRAPRSIPASETKRLSLKIKVVIAGKEIKFKPCSFSIIFPARFKLLKQYKLDKTEGISINKLSDRSSDTRFAAKQLHAGAVNVWSEQSIRQRNLRLCHLSSGRECKFKFDVEDDNEELDMTLLDRYIAARPFEEELLLELEGRGEVARLNLTSGESESGTGRVCVGGGLACGRGGEDSRGSLIYEGEWTCRELLCRRLSASSRTRSIISSEGSLILPLLTMRDRRVSDRTCHPEKERTSMSDISSVVTFLKGYNETFVSYNRIKKVQLGRKGTPRIRW
jgi:hypothetical protein